MPEQTFHMIATFDSPEHAALAKVQLEDEGIPVQLGDQELMAVEWLTWNAIGTIMLGVQDTHIEKAVARLEEYFGETVRLISQDIDEAELERQALAEAPEEEMPPEE